ncbi:type I glyceraldehyde-3-phosphate dehydrogenase [Rhizobium sp. YTU87027]|uniref:type I glyceraldehyde-3-phosphate dehydrogenase n=1 Tax=Rhizobium sp. YTU87027 TaxID=3417741 RepID=UPI003D699949
MARVTRIAINGFGRIGRTILRQALDASGIEVVLINDLAAIELSGYLFQYDSIFGPWNGSVIVDQDAIRLSGRSIRYVNSRNIEEFDLDGVDVVLDCTGAVDADLRAARCLEAGASQVLISGPASKAEATLILGANEERFNGERIVSNGSCTTNALAPLLRILDELFGVTGGQMTTVHCYTGSQPTIDQPRADFARSRAAALSMVPTTTSAHRLLSEVLPHLAGLIEARAIRVPTASVSAIDLTVGVRHGKSLKDMVEDIRAAAASSPVLGWIDQPLVSVDMRGRPESLVISEAEISLSANGLLRIFGWYDNEWAFAARMLDMARYISRRAG